MHLNIKYDKIFLTNTCEKCILYAYICIHLLKLCNPTYYLPYAGRMRPVLSGAGRFIQMIITEGNGYIMKTKGKCTKRLLSLLLSAVLLLGILPASALAVQVAEDDIQSELLDKIDEVGVYGWRLVDNDGNVVGGIRYPANDGSASHNGNSMDLEPYLSGLTDSRWGNYENATVHIGTADKPFDTPENTAEFVQKIKDTYKLEVFLVSTHYEYDTATVTFPYAWVRCDITDATYDGSAPTPTFTLSVSAGGVDAFYWDYSNITGGRYLATFRVTADEPDREPDLTQSGVYGWQVLDKDGNFVGGVGYNTDAGWPQTMDLNSYFHDDTVRQNYEFATVHLGSANMLFDTQENIDAFIKNITENYTLAVFFVQVDASLYKNNKYPCKWIEYPITGASCTLDENLATQTFTLEFDGVENLFWDYSTSDGPGREDPNAPSSRYKATFAVTATETDRPLDSDKELYEAGVYGWRIRDNASGEVLGGVRYPVGGNAGEGSTAMGLNDYFTDGTYVGDWPNQGTANSYEIAMVNLGGIIGMTLANDADYEAFKKTFKENYSLEIFFVDTNGGYKDGKYPYEWVVCEIEDVVFADPVEQNGQTPTTHTLTLKAKGDTNGPNEPNGYFWDYSTLNGPGRENPNADFSRYKATFAVTATEPMKMEVYTVTAWGVTDGDAFTAMTTNHEHWVDDLGRPLTDLYKAPLDWPTFCNKGELDNFLSALAADYQLRISYRDYENVPYPWDTAVNVPIKKAEQTATETDEYGNTFVLIELTPAVVHKLGWHWTEPWVNSAPDTAVMLEKYVIRVQLVDPVTDEVAKAHTVTSRVVDPPSTKVNFFDYWLEDDGQFLNDFEAYQPGTEQEIVNKGINRGHLFSFMGSFAFPLANGCFNIANLGRWNVWTGDTSFAPYPDSNVAENNDGYGTSYGNFTTGNPDGILKPHSGIVARKLVDGYPQLALGGDAWAGGIYGNEFPTSGRFNDFYADALGKTSESLAYLFNTEGSDYKEVVEDVTGLFQLDNQGYYYFNSQQNFAELDRDKKEITLYDTPWKVSASVDVDNATTAAKGQFFPFNEWASLFSISDGESAVSQNHYNFRSQNASTPWAPINHYFGMTVETEFQQPINGTITQGRMGGDKDIPMEFYFSGDDDVWIFIDDVLVGDIGGIHNPVSININFATGVIEYTAIDAPGAMNAEPYYTTTLKAMYDAANPTRAGSSDWVEVEYTVTDEDGKTETKTGHIYPNGSIHTLKFYYLERGNDVSNCSIRFNTLPVVKDSIRKVDDNGDINYDAKFDLYKATANRTIEADKWYKVADFTKGELIAEGLVINNDKKNPDLYTIMYEDGRAVDFTKFVADFSKLEYFLLDEVVVPDGFRGSPGIVLEFHPSTYTFTVKNKYETGAYASFSAEWKQIINELYSANFVNGQLTPNENDLIPNVQGGLTVVVPLMKTGGKWQPLYGSNTKGWHTVQSTGSLNKDLAQAALLQIAGIEGMGYQKWVMDLTDTGNLFGSMANLPGDATRYVINQLEDDISAADLTLVALFIPQATLNGKLGVTGTTNSALYEALLNKVNGLEDVSGLMAKVSESDFTLLYSNDFQRSYRTVIYAPNEQRELRVRKVDTEGNYLNGAVFALFDSAADAAAFIPKGETADAVIAELGNASGLMAYGKTGTITMEVSGEEQDGMLIFRGILPKGAGDGYAKMNWPKDRDAENTEYWLKEVFAPEGYKPNGNLVRVEVGNTTIYANATGYDSTGKLLTGDDAANDGITVQATMGKLAQTLVKYAINNTVDVTLRDITITKQTQADADKLNHSNWYSTSETFNLHFGLDSAALGSQYGLHEAGDPIFEVSDGYVRAMPRQNLPKDAEHTTTAKLETLGSIELDSLFGLPNTVVVANQPIPVSIEVSKAVEGEAGETDTYAFGITLTPAADNTQWKDKDGWMKEITVLGYLHEAGHTVDGKPCTVADHLKAKDCVELTFTYNEDGVYTTDALCLAAGEAYALLDLPEGTGYKIVETIEVDKAQTAYTEDDYATDIEVTVGDKTEQSLLDAEDRTVSGTLPKAEKPGKVPPAVHVDYTNKLVLNHGSLSVTKKVTGTGGDRTKAFTFTITLNDKSINGTYGDMTFENGVAVITLKHGETKIATGLPAGFSYVVEESNNGGYTVTKTEDTGTIPANDTAQVLFENHLDAPSVPPFIPTESTPATGDESNIMAWLTLAALSAAGLCAACFLFKRKQKVSR